MWIMETEVMEVETAAEGYLPAAPGGNAPFLRMAAASFLLHVMALGFLFMAAVNPFSAVESQPSLPVIHVTLSPLDGNNPSNVARFTTAPSEREDAAVHAQGKRTGTTPVKRNPFDSIPTENRAFEENREIGLASGPALTVPAPSRPEESVASGNVIQGNQVAVVTGGGRFPEPTLDSLPVRPRYLDTPSPVYPAEARSRGYEGTTLLTVEVLANGRVGQVLVKKSSGHVVLDRSALRAVQSWRFEPARIKRIPHAMTVDIPIRFSLEGQR